MAFGRAERQRQFIRFGQNMSAPVREVLTEDGDRAFEITIHASKPVVVRAPTLEELDEKAQRAFESVVKPYLLARETRKREATTLRYYRQTRPGLVMHVMKCLANPELWQEAGNDHIFDDEYVTRYADVGEQYWCAGLAFTPPNFNERRRGPKRDSASDLASRLVDLLLDLYPSPHAARRAGRQFFGPNWDFDMPKLHERVALPTVPLWKTEVIADTEDVEMRGPGPSWARKTVAEELELARAELMANPEELHRRARKLTRAKISPEA